MIALPPVPSMVEMAIATLITGNTMLREDKALLPTKREMNIPSTMVYRDMNTIMMMEGAANFNRSQGEKLRLMDVLI